MTTNTSYSSAVEQLCAYLDEHGMRHTREREVILEKVCDLRCFSVEQVRNVLTEMTISRATIYNTLDVLQKAGIIHRLDKEFGVRAGQYEVRTGERGARHHHPSYVGGQAFYQLQSAAVLLVYLRDMQGMPQETDSGGQVKYHR